MTQPGPPEAAVLLLHGGRETGLGVPPPGPFNLPAVRMRPFARVLRGALPREVLVRAVRYGHRGWNGDRADPLHDAVRALDVLRRTAGEIPVVLLGHSMGGRAALAAAGHPLVRGVVGLARGARRATGPVNSPDGTSSWCTAPTTGSRTLRTPARSPNGPGRAAPGPAWSPCRAATTRCSGAPEPGTV